MDVFAACVGNRASRLAGPTTAALPRIDPEPVFVGLWIDMDRALLPRHYPELIPNPTLHSPAYRSDLTQKSSR